MKTIVVGSWHLASVYAVGLFALGHEVRLIVPEEVRKNYEAGKTPVYEPGLEEEMEHARREGRLSFSSDINDTANSSEFCFFAEDCKVTEAGVDLILFRELFDPAASSHQFKTIIISSQLPLGTCRNLAKDYPDLNIVYLPEFLRLGSALERFLKPDYIVIGGNKSVTSKVMEFFSAIDCPKFEVSLEEAEMAKHAANIFVAMSVSFVSELTKFSESYNVNLERVGEILRHDKRIGSKAYVLPGMGFSGETVERDIRVLLNLAKKVNIDLPLFREVVGVNNEHNLFIEKKLKDKFPILSGLKIGFLGATYRPFTSTLRGSVFASLMEKLAGQGAEVLLFDPHVEDFAFLTKRVENVFDGSEAVIISVPKACFKDIDYPKMVRLMRGRVLIDAANLLALDQARALGVDYYSIGRGILSA